METKNKHFEQSSNKSRSNQDQKQQFNELAQDLSRIREKMCETGEAISQCAHDARAEVGSVIQRTLKNTKECSHEYQESLVNYVQQNPVKSILCASFIGLCIARLSRN
jgi:ElaB/YqjD/DUF883 family membrane-anchored ribosome-binding protein